MTSVTSENSATGKKWLASMTAALRNTLRQSDKIRTRFEQPLQTNTGGWSTGLGHSRAAKNTKVEVWRDQYFGLPPRKQIFWFGFHWYSRSAFRKACGLWESRVRDDCRVTNRDVSLRNKTYTLKEPHRVGRSYLERYSPEFFFGVFRRITETREGKAALVSEVARFLNDALTTDGRIDLAYVERNVLKKEEVAALEERRLVAESKCFRRSRTLALRCKERDSYTCRGCGFKFVTFYAGMVKDYAEAHHLVPLHKKKGKKKTKPKDLITVCANCHRMLHRLHGTRSDLQVLRKMVKTGRIALQR